MTACGLLNAARFFFAYFEYRRRTFTGYPHDHFWSPRDSADYLYDNLGVQHGHSRPPLVFLLPSTSSSMMTSSLTSSSRADYFIYSYNRGLHRPLPHFASLWLATVPEASSADPLTLAHGSWWSLPSHNRYWHHRPVPSSPTFPLA
jgi:hypothetical protein